MIMPYPKGIDCLWIACDTKGNIAAFTTAGIGPIPNSILQNEDHINNAEEWVYALPCISSALLNVNMPHPEDFIAMAERGLFAYDWSDIHRTKLKATNSYELIAVPTKPLSISEIVKPSFSIITLDVVFETSTLVTI